MVRIFFCLILSENCVKCLVFLVSDHNFWPFFLGNEAKSAEIDYGILEAVRNSDKISMTKNIFDRRV